MMCFTAACGYVVYNANAQVRSQQEKIYAMVNGSFSEAVATERNIPVELRDHIEQFHYGSSGIFLGTSHTKCYYNEAQLALASMNLHAFFRLYITVKWHFYRQEDRSGAVRRGGDRKMNRSFAMRGRWTCNSKRDINMPVRKLYVTHHMRVDTVFDVRARWPTIPAGRYAAAVTRAGYSSNVLTWRRQYRFCSAPSSPI